MTRQAKNAAVKIECSHSEVWPTEKLVEHPRNPNKHPPEQLRLLGKVIAATGWRAPIVVSKRSGFVIKGHGRLQAARLAGMTEVPVDLQDYATEADEWADMIADNRIAELAEMAQDDLRELIGDLQKTGADTELAGFTKNEFEALMAEKQAPEDFQTVDENIETDHQCPKCGYKFSGGNVALESVGQ